jgi:hypothetical protein
MERDNIHLIFHKCKKSVLSPGSRTVTDGGIFVDKEYTNRTGAALGYSDYPQPAQGSKSSGRVHRGYHFAACFFDESSQTNKVD